MSPRSSSLTGEAGEHYVAFSLARLGFQPAVLRKNSKGVDLLATADGSKVLSIQVKASAARRNPRQWMVGKKKPVVSKNCFHVFLNIREDNSPVDSYVFTSAEVLKRASWHTSAPTFCISRKEENRKNSWQLIKDFLHE